MNAQQLLDHIIKPTHTCMGGNYESKNANMLSLATVAIESNCGDKIKQDGGPALGPWQMEPKTGVSIWINCDVLQNPAMIDIMTGFCLGSTQDLKDNLLRSPMYACAMARLKYGMDEEALPNYSDKRGIYLYYKRIFNTEGGASTWGKFCAAWTSNGLDNIEL